MLDCELEILGILLIVDLRVMDMSEFDRCHPWDGLVDGWSTDPQVLGRHKLR